MRRLTAWATAATIVTGAVLGVAGCSAAASPGAGGAASAGAGVRSCGNTKTAAGVPVTVDVVKGSVDCGAALRVEDGYATAIRAGDLHGNGGGGPVSVGGWNCESYPTPQALRTGRVSECHTAKAEVVAVLALPSSAASTGS